jgi:MerR family copper efflux transcriptional regulator
MTPRMLRYRESLGLLPALRPSRRRGSRRAASTARPGGQPGGGSAGGHRQFTDTDMAAVALGLSIERRYDISPVALAFGVRVLADPRVRAEVAELGRRIGRLQPQPARALDFEQERAQRLLRLATAADTAEPGRREIRPPGPAREGARRDGPG